ncbi:metalloendopeptidase, partial [Elysia marginata]
PHNDYTTSRPRVYYNYISTSRPQAYPDGFTTSRPQAPHNDYTTSRPRDCGHDLYGNWGEIRSPRHDPDDLFNYHCVWTITTDPDTQVCLWFAGFDLKNDCQPECLCDKLLIYNGNHRLTGGTPDSPLATYCGSSPPHKLTATGNKMTIEFWSSSSGRRTGFNATWSQFPPRQQSNDSSFQTSTASSNSFDEARERTQSNRFYDQTPAMNPNNFETASTISPTDLDADRVSGRAETKDFFFQTSTVSTNGFREASSASPTDFETALRNAAWENYFKKLAESCRKRFWITYGRGKGYTYSMKQFVLCVKRTCPEPVRAPTLLSLYN